MIKSDLLVSVCIVAYNEEDYIENIIKDIELQTYPHDKIEILLIDGMSTDTTKTLMESFKSRATGFHNVRILDNPARKQAAGWNVAIKEYSGDVIIRVDAHASIPKDFVEKNIELICSGEYVCGGKRPNLIQNDSAWGRTLLLAEQSMFGSSIASFRNSDSKKYVKSLFHGAYRREVFDKAGLFNENLGRTEDNEMHYRIRKEGYKICYSPDIVSYQYARSSLSRMLKQKYGNGFWVMLTLKSCPQCLSLYHFVPFCFILGILFTGILAFLGWPLLAMLMWGLYAAVSVCMTVIAVIGSKKEVTHILLPILFLLLHVSYGMGSFIALFKLPFWKESRI